MRAKSGDALVFAEYKDVWLATESQPESCIGLGRMMLSSPLMSAQDKQQRLWVQLRAGFIWTGACYSTDFGFEFVFGSAQSDSGESTELLMVSTKNQ